MVDFLLPCLITGGSSHGFNSQETSAEFARPCSPSRTSQPIQTDCSHLGDKRELCLAMHGWTVFLHQQVKYGKEQVRCMCERN